METTQVKEYLRCNKQRLMKKYNLSRLGIFGSRARGDENKFSDIDVIVEFDINTKNLHHLKHNLKNELQDEFNVPVDICREKYIKPILKERILSDAQYV